MKTLAEQREKLLTAIGQPPGAAEAVVAAISAAGFFIVGPEVTAEALEALYRVCQDVYWDEEAFIAMLAVSDLAGER